ncbi:MAG: hypothetical protein M5R36_02860 [Deltaproteobacteria bacterium]|nr:hypothetical protein [Deltaproteobacteria bacterium]
MLDHLFPAGGRIPEGASDVALDEKLWRFAAEQGAPLVLAFRALMRFWEHAAPVLCGRFASLSSLSESEREHVIERIAASRISLLRQTVFQLKFLGGLHFYGEPRVAAALGVVPPKVAK